MLAMKNILFCLCITAISAQVALGASDAGPPRRLNRHKNRGPSRMDLSQFEAAIVEKRNTVIDAAHIGVIPVLPVDAALPAQDSAILFPRHKAQSHGLKRHRRHMQDQQQQQKGKDDKGKDGKNRDGMNMNGTNDNADTGKDGKRADTAGLIQIPQGQTVIIVNDNGNLKTEGFQQFLAENGGGATTKTKTVTQTQILQTSTTNSFFSSSTPNIVAVSSSGGVNFAPTATGIGAHIVQQQFITTLNDAQKSSLSAVVAAASAASASVSSGGAYGAQYGASVTSSAASSGATTTGNVVFPSNGQAGTTTTTQANIVAVSTRATSTTSSSAAANSGNPSSGIGLKVVGTSTIQAAQLSSIASSAAASAPSS